MNVIVRRRCACGMLEKYSASPSIAATPDPLSTAASQKPSVCAMTRMFSSVMPGRTPKTADGLRSVRDSISEPHPEFHRRAALDQLAQHGAVVEADREPGDFRQIRSLAAAAPELRREVARDAEDDDDRRRAFLFGQQHRAVRFGGVVQGARRRNAVDDDGLAAHVASGEVGGRAEADVDRLEVEPGRRRADRSEDRMRASSARRSRRSRCSPPTTVGNQAGGSGVSSSRTSMPKLRSFAATSCCASACAGVPVIRPHHRSPASRLLREIAASCSTYGLRCAPSMRPYTAAEAGSGHRR